ncbi:MAG TPA: M20/M25/M40 family metallo-hydrolase [Clostridia bacterium]|nr:M20/M25/M40 family metallo-hydrolase [Clostridia bacterium]
MINRKYGPFPSSEEILSSLIAFRTVNGDEYPSAQWLAGLLRRLGMDVSVQVVGENRANVFAQAGTGEGLLLCGHLDVVPAHGDWSTPPFELVKKDGAYFGRGCADMKGGIAAMVGAVHRFLSSGEGLNKRIALLFVRHFLQRRDPGIRYAVIGEPTELQIAVAHRGVARFRIAVRGKSAHSSVAREGINALEGAMLLFEACRRENERLQCVRHPILPPPSLNVTVLHGGEQDNIIPGEASMILDYRIHPGVDYGGALRTVEAIVESVKRQNPEFGFSVFRHCFLSGGEIAPEDPFVKKCCEAARACLGGAFAPREFQATCEQSLYIDAGIQTVICGPGDIKQAHTVNESLPEKQLHDAERLYYGMIRSFNRDG